MSFSKLMNFVIESIKEHGKVDVLKIHDTLVPNEIIIDDTGGIFNSPNGNAQTKKFEKSIALSRVVLKTVAWLNSPDGTLWMRQNGKIWSNEEIGHYIFGWKKSFFYKMLKAGKLSNDILIQYSEYCSTRSHNKIQYSRSIEDLLKFAKNMAN